ncbi:hypothetical protein C8A05DRAFT_14336 [Staphylotrichum tortipilum]|uniref:BTB domain-containing protein n=1 Tax=Staphylotrichum tortipilum TaxID=2831512 RepID=A0AAN6RUY9_9PEZI|nr:hypothetical protein C8A05DRAFT_14336 [Staphylotrichum longicolle]
MSTPSDSPSSAASSSPTPSRTTAPIVVPILSQNFVASSPSPHITPIIIDPLGDLTLLVGADHTDDAPVRIQVSSGALRRASPVFHAMLFGGWRKSRPADGSDWVVDLPDDRALAMQIMLGAAHARFEFVPAEIVREAEFGVASAVLVAAENYCMMGVLVPFADAWVGTLSGAWRRWGGREVVQRGACSVAVWGGEGDVLCFPDGRVRDGEGRGG